MGIRFIDLSNKLGCFAFYETTVDRFMEYNGNQTWVRWESFERDFRADPTTVPCESPDYLKAYCEDWVFGKPRDTTCSHCSRDMTKNPYARCSNDGICVSITDFEERIQKDSVGTDHKGDAVWPYGGQR